MSVFAPSFVCQTHHNSRTDFCFFFVLAQATESETRLHKYGPESDRFGREAVMTRRNIGTSSEPGPPDSRPNQSQAAPLPESRSPTHHTFRRSFSAVSTPNFATKYSFCSIFRDLQDLHTFAPLQTKKSSQIFVNIFAIFVKFACNLSDFLVNFVNFRFDFCRIFTKFCRIH